MLHAWFSKCDGFSKPKNVIWRPENRPKSSFKSFKIHFKSGSKPIVVQRTFPNLKFFDFFRRPDLPIFSSRRPNFHRIWSKFTTKIPFQSEISTQMIVSMLVETFGAFLEHFVNFLKFRKFSTFFTSRTSHFSPKFPFWDISGPHFSSHFSTSGGRNSAPWIFPASRLHSINSELSRLQN